MPQIQLPYKPFPIHEAYHRTRAREKAAIGAVGSGKTIALCADAIQLGLQQPGSRIMIARQTIPALRDTTETEFVNLIATPPDEDADEYMTLWDLCVRGPGPGLGQVSRLGGHIDRIVFPNGTEFLFRSLDNWRKHMSLNLAAVYIDEASECEIDAYYGLQTRLRQMQPTPMARKQGVRWDPLRIRQHIALATNPNGHDWIWELFVHKATRDRRYFRSTSFDNPTLYMPDGSPSPYLFSLLAMPEMWVRRYVLCEFDAFAGQVLPFDPSKHVVPAFPVPDHWERAMGLDWGLRNPTAVVWWAREPGTTTWYQYREWQTYDPLDPIARDSYQTLSAPQVAAVIKSIEGTEKIKYRAADPAIKARQGETTKSNQYWFDMAGVHFEMGAKEYDPRITAMTHMLHAGELKIMDSCPLTAMALQQYRWEDMAVMKGDAPEKPLKKHDHLVDATGYIATLFHQAITLRPAPKIETLSDEIWKQVGKQVRRTHGGGRSFVL
jgi:PBSX family phage terminase large subunit